MAYQLESAPSLTEPTERVAVPLYASPNGEQLSAPEGDSTGADRDQARMVYLLAKVFHAIRARHLEPTFKKFDLTPLQYTILSLVQDHPGLSSADLSRRFYVSQQNMGQLLGALESRDLIRRQENSENRRMLLVSTTLNGAALVGLCHRAMDVIEQALFAEMESVDQATLRRCLVHLAAKAQVV